MAVSMRTTSVPRWSVRLSDVDPVLADVTVSGLVIVVDVTVSDEVVDDLVAKAVSPTHVVRVDGNGSSGLETVLADARVGWRFLVIGSEASAGRVRAQIMAAGAIDDEISVVTTEESDMTAMRRRDVFCGHCHEVTSAVTAVDGVVDCGGCASELTVYYHYSRRHSAFLGYRADSEDVP